MSSPLRLAVLVVCLGMAGRVDSQTAQCVPVGAPDYGTCAGLDADCCHMWLLECNLACSSLVLPEVAGTCVCARARECVCESVCVVCVCVHACVCLLVCLLAVMCEFT